MAEFAETFRLVIFALAALVAVGAYLWIRRRGKPVNWVIKRWGAWGMALSLALYGLATALLLIILFTGPLIALFAVWIWSGVTCASEPPTASHYQKVIGELSAAASSVDYPRWTPDGKRVVFTFALGHGAELYIADAEGREVSKIPASQMSYRVGAGYSHSDVSSPSVRPQGDLVAYATASHIETASLDGSRIAALEGTEHIDVSPVWSPSGDRIAFIAYSVDSCSWPKIEAEGVYTMRRDGTDARRIADLDMKIIESDLENASHPRWSPDGTFISFVGFGEWNDGDRESAIYAVNSDGSDMRRLFASSTTAGRYIASPPEWAPDGRRIAFLGYDDGKTKVYTIGNDGLVLREGSDTGVDLSSAIESRGYVDLNLSWSSDGSRIRFSAHGAIYTANADGSGVRAFSPPELEYSYPVWSPDDSRLALLDKVRDNDIVISIMRLDAPEELDVIVKIKWRDPVLRFGGTLAANSPDDDDSPQR